MLQWMTQKLIQCEAESIVGQSRLAFIEKLIPFLVRKTSYTPSIFFKINKT